MSVSAHIAAQRTDHGVPHAVSWRALGVAASTFYKWRGRAPTPAQRRRADLDVEVGACFDASGGTYGSPRVRAELRRSGREVSKKTVEASMARQGLQGRARRRRRGLTRPDRRAEPVPDLLRRDFTADGVDEKWVGDFKQVNTGEGPVFLATVEDLFSRRMLGFAQSDRHPTAELATDAVNMAAAVRGGAVAGVIFHTDKGSQGGFNRWSQHLVMEVCGDGCWQASAGDSCDAGPDVVAGAALDGAARGPGPVLGGDRSRGVERGRGRCRWGVVRRRVEVVPAGWRDATDLFGSGVGPLSVFRGA